MALSFDGHLTDHNPAAGKRFRTGPELAGCRVSPLFPDYRISPPQAWQFAPFYTIDYGPVFGAHFKLPGEKVATAPVDNRNQVHEVAQDRQIGDVSAPDLVDMSNRQIAQQIGIAFMPVARRTAASPGASGE